MKILKLIILFLCLAVNASAQPFGGAFNPEGPSSTYQIFTNTNKFVGILDASDITVQQALEDLSFIVASPTTVTSQWNFANGNLVLPQGTTCPNAGTCTDGAICYDTNATSGQRVYACESGTWTLQGDGGGGGGDNITVNTTAATNANFLDNLYIDWAIDTAATPDDITSKFNYAETLAGNPALLTTEVVFTADGLLAEGTTADTIEIKLAFPDPATTDKTVTLPNATDTLVGKDTTDTLTNKTMAAASNVLDADTAVALAADPTDCATATHFAVGVIASGAATCEAIGDADIPDSATVTGWELGIATAATSLTSPIFASNNADPADAGIVRLGNAENIAWEASPAGTDETLTVSVSENFQISSPIEIDASDPADAEAIRLDNAEGIAWEASPAGTDLTLKVDASEILQASGTFNAGTLTEGANDVFNSTETPGGQLGGTWASPTVDASHSGSTHHYLMEGTDGNTRTATHWVEPSGTGGTTETIADEYTAPETCTASAMYVGLQTAPGAGTSWTICANVNGTVLTEPCCTISDTETSCSETTNTGTITGGQSFNWEYAATGAVAGTGTTNVVMICTP